jgi:hypothetical protein
MLLFDTFANDETHSFIGFSTVSNIELLIVSVPVLIILLFLANGINDKIKSSDTPDQKGLSLMEFLAAIIVIIAYPSFEYTYNTLYRNATIHKAKVFEADYYQKLTPDEKDYFKLELLGENNGCKNNISCQDGFNYQIKLKDIDQIITDIKKQRETKTPPQTTPDIGNQLNKKFWELIQK